MEHKRNPQILLLALLASAAVWAAPAADQRSGAAPAAVSGMYTVIFNVQPGPALAAGGKIACRARIAPNLRAFDNLGQGAAPVASAAGVSATVGGDPASSVNCSVEIPFAWLVNDQEGGVALSYEIYAIGGSGVAAIRARQGMNVAYPESGGTANVRLTVVF